MFNVNTCLNNQRKIQLEHLNEQKTFSMFGVGLVFKLDLLGVNQILDLVLQGPTVVGVMSRTVRVVCIPLIGMMVGVEVFGFRRRALNVISPGFNICCSAWASDILILVNCLLGATSLCWCPCLCWAGVGLEIWVSPTRWSWRLFWPYTTLDSFFLLYDFSKHQIV